MQPQLHRQLGVSGATLMGLGSILGTGVFVSIGIAAGVTGPAVILAVVLAGFVATCNALSSAQLAASHPVSGGTYEYGYAYLSAPLGFTAGWMFICAKSASAATAALGCAGYLLHATGWGREQWLVPLALLIAALLTAIVLTGVSRSNWANIIIVTITLISLIIFIAAGLPTAAQRADDNLSPFFTTGDQAHVGAGFLQACALMFVAYTGYGRIATMGEEIRDPRRNIPRAIVTTLIVSALLYVAVGFVAIASVGAEQLGSATRQQAAPLEVAARSFALPGRFTVHPLIAIGAVTAMLGVLLNLILGLSRVLLAMGRRGDMPRATAALNAANTTPYIAVVVIGVIVMGLTALGNVRVTWSFSAFTVLIYYAITNAAALRLPPEHRLYSRFWAWTGLASCLFLAFWVEWQIWLAGLALIAAGLLWQRMMRSLKRSTRAS